MEDVAPVPKVARLLRDGQGKFMYIGDSASLSFLQSLRPPGVPYSFLGLQGSSEGDPLPFRAAEMLPCAH
jgi:hypothetical protein